MQLPQLTVSYDRLSKLAFGTLASLAFAGVSGAQVAPRVNFSIDWHGPTVGMPDSAFGFPITEGDVLRPALGVPAFGPLAPPAIQYSAGFAPVPGLGLFMHAPCAGHPGGTPCLVEVDALDYGRSISVAPGMVLKGRVLFSVDRFAAGGGPIPPCVASESAPGVFEASADVFVGLGLLAGPLAPGAAALPGNTAVLDGNGLISGSGFTYRGLGLVEPNPPGPGPAAPGDNLDALALGLPNSPVAFPPLGIWFSLDSGFLDPLTGVPNSGSAAAHGFLGGDVLHVALPGGPPALYAPAPVLGLGLMAFADADDLDALSITENGLPGYQPSVFPNDWAAGATDMLLFSVRRGSAIIGMPDSIFGLPICEGDILTTPLPIAFGGVSPFPGIYIAAENLGLATARIPAPGVGISSDLDALELPIAPLFDCNSNGIEDAYEIAVGSLPDSNLNGVPDSCELISTAYCFCPAPLGPCGNHDATAGCQNSTGVGGLLSASGSSSVGADNLVLTATQLPLNKPGLLLQGGSTVAGVPFFDGRRCVNGPIFRHPGTSTGGTGTVVYGPGLAAYSVANFGVAGWLVPGSVFHFQFWHRDTLLPCGTRANLTNAVSVTFLP